MKIKDIVSINSQAVLSNAIQLAWYSDSEQKEQNDRLVGGYVFGNGVNRKIGNRTEISSLPVFERIRDSFGNPQASNIFTIIARYGHGKSHFALVLANYFGLPPTSPVITDIINHIETCSDTATASHFRHFKNQTNKAQLVVTLAGHTFQDLRQGFLQALRRALDANEVTRNHPIKSISTEAAKWLRTLKGDYLRRADEYLGDKYRTDVDTLLTALENFESGKETIVKDLSRELYGIAADFGADVNLKEVIKEIVNGLCRGADAPFHNMLILFDELGVYAQNWCHNPAAAGNLAPQEIFEACSDLPGKLVFVGFVQRELSEFVQNFALEEEFRRWAGRMPPESTYWLISNLEEVIGKLIVKKEKWKEVIQNHAPRIIEESGITWESIQRYQDTWKGNSFYETVGRNCFPLHPFTTGLMCGFDFTQGSRTIIGAVNSMLSSAEENEVSENSRLKWIRPIQLVEEFEVDFKKDSPEYSNYEYALKTLSIDAKPIYFNLLKALFLFKEGKLKKQNHNHIQLLAHLAGYTENETEEALKSLKDDYDAIRYSSPKREYEFTGVGTNRNEVLTLVKREIAGKHVDNIVKYLIKLDILKELKTHDSQARDFKMDFAVEGDEWYLEPRYLDAARLNPESVKKLCIETINEGAARGTVIYLLSAGAAELDEAREQAEVVFNKLKEENFSHPFVIAIPREAATQIEKQILIKNYLIHGMSNPQKVQFGDAHKAAREFARKELTDQVVAHIRTVEFIVPEHLHLGNSQRKNLDEIADALFSDAYKFRPPSNANVMKPTGAKGNTATAEIARQLIVNDLNFELLNTEKQNVIKNVLTEGTNKWGVLDSTYKIKDPSNVRVKEAWRMLRKNVSETEWTSFASLLTKLMMPPFGYDDYTATFLITSWIGRHKHELGFKDHRSQRANTQLNLINLTLGDLQNKLNKSKDFLKWLCSDVSVQHSGRANKRRAKDFLDTLQTVSDPAESKKLLAQVSSVLQTLAAGDELIAQIKQQAQELSERIYVAELEEKSLEQFKTAAIQATDITNILRVDEMLKTFGEKNEMQSNTAFVETRAFVNKQIETIARRQSQTNLSRIESYDSIYGGLEKSRKALQKAGRSDLETLFVSALEKVKSDYEKLKAIENEQPLITEINAIQIGGMPLRFYTDGLRGIEEILAQNPSERVQERARTKQKKLKEEIKNLHTWAQELSSRVNDIKEIRAARQLQQDILRRESVFQESAEAELLSESLEKLAARISELEQEERAKEEAERERQRIERERAAAKSIAAQFAQIQDAEQRFNLLVEVLQEAKNAGLSEEQTRTLIDLLH